MTKKTHISYKLAWFCVVLFGISLFGPAVDPDMGAWNKPDSKPVPGFMPALVCWWFYPSNLAVLLSPLLIFICVRLKRSRIALYVLLSFYVLSPFMVMFSAGDIRSVGWGFYLWCFTYLFAAVAAGWATDAVGKRLMIDDI